MILKKATFFTGCLIFLFTSCSTPSDSSEATESLSSETYNLLLQRSLDNGFPGIIIGIQKGDDKNWVGSAGYSNIEEQKSMLKTDRYHLASVTKIFTSVAILKLIDEGKIEINSKVIDYLDSSLVSPIPFINEVEIGQLLDHSSGIYSFNNDLEYLETLIGKSAFKGANWTNEEYLSLAYGDRVNPQGEPGTGNYYSDTNLILLGLIIENISGKPFRQFIQETILQPLNLQNTGFYSEVVNPNNVELTTTVQGYLKRSEDLDAFITIHDAFREVSPGIMNTTIAGEKIDAGAGMVSTAEDLLTFGTALYKGDLLSSKSLDWLLSIGQAIENEEIDTKRQGIVTVRNKSYGVLYTSLGDGPGGMNTMLAYHPTSKTVVVAFTNIFGNFNEHDFFIDEIIPQILKGEKAI